MRLEWIVEINDKKAISDLIKEQQRKVFVQERIQRNITISSTSKKMIFSKELFWREVIGSLVTTQQKSGTGSRPEKLYNEEPFPLSLKSCTTNINSLTQFACEILRSRGFRFCDRNGSFIYTIFNWLNNEGWYIVEEAANKLIRNRNKEPSFCDSEIKLERNAAELIKDSFKGFGPKQSRNLWQSLGLFRYEIPIDSRVTQWLNQHFSFPVKLSADGLSDSNYYQFVMEGIQELCKECKILPCLLDAAIFAIPEKK